MMVGRQLRSQLRPAHPPGEVALVVRGLCTRAFPRASVDFELRCGEVVGIAGLLGSGGVDLLPGQRHYNPTAVLAVLDRIAQERGVARELVALAWILKHPAKIVPIIGTTQPEQIKQLAAAADLELTREEWYHLVTAARGAEMP